MADKDRKKAYEGAGSYRFTPRQRRYLPVKRAMDVALALVLLAVLAAPMLIIAAAVKLSSPDEPILFRQRRVGRGERLFTLYKFRSMAHGQRITAVGRFLRAASLDELPQLFLVLTGSMSLIGPRPLIPEEDDVRRLRRALDVYLLRPGISGLAQINGRDRLTASEKAAYDRIYLEELSFRRDVSIFFLTVVKVLRRADIEKK